MSSCPSLNSWDEWVGVDRLLKHTEENIQKQQANNKKYGVEKNTRVGRGAQVKPKSSNGKILHLVHFSWRSFSKHWLHSFVVV